MQTLTPRSIAVFFVALLTFVGTMSCQRASTAYLAPTYHPAAQRLAVNPPAPKPLADSLLTASLQDEVPLSTKPAWAASTEPVLASTVESAISQPAVRHASKRARLAKPVPPQCDQIVLRNGDVIEAKIKEVGVNEIKYKKCERPDGPDYTISKRDVLSIKYSTGDVERFTSAANPSTSRSSGGGTSYNSPTNSQDDGPRTDPFAIVSIATGGLAILTGYGAFLLGAAAIVFGALSLTRIRKEPGRFKGKGLALGGMIAGLVSAAVILLYVLF
ncbi:DUF4190 domain-containing protein [Spirosoma radiotolerans]|uniref:DUF4190 domain-containing protein n=1 Tax=Spirosoma radiotolerans TaxID=1379870 RepID=A0A0E3V741_9BACT|nr:DUF4190 domain-containing protein [Spirosoma radiotolerans]AKD55086.1 hypothetical protein SD10_09370 [Spirosoma radiotolerans]